VQTRRPTRPATSERTSKCAFRVHPVLSMPPELSESAKGPFFYSVFGLTFRSNLPLSKLPEAVSIAGSADCDLYFNKAPGSSVCLGPRFLSFESSYTDAKGEPCLRIWSLAEGAYSQMSYSDGHQFWLSRAGKDVWATWPENSSFEEATAYLIGPVLGVLLRYRGVVCLHGSAVAKQGRAIAFVGQPGAGKSTTAAALAQRGYTLLADDIAALEERAGVFYVHPAYPGLSLWPKSLELLYGALKPELRPRVNGDKACLSSAQGLQFEASALPLDRIYVLDSAEPESSSLSGANSAQERFLSLVSNTYATSILDSSMRAAEFGILGRLASAIPIRRIEWDRSPGAIERRCDLVISSGVHLR
jgi:hypothetical protein